MRIGHRVSGASPLLSMIRSLPRSGWPCDSPGESARKSHDPPLPVTSRSESRPILQPFARVELRQDHDSAAKLPPLPGRPISWSISRRSIGGSGAGYSRAAIKGAVPEDGQQNNQLTVRARMSGATPGCDMFNQGRRAGAPVPKAALWSFHSQAGLLRPRGRTRSGRYGRASAAGPDQAGHLPYGPGKSGPE